MEEKRIFYLCVIILAIIFLFFILKESIEEQKIQRELKAADFYASYGLTPENGTIYIGDNGVAYLMKYYETYYEYYIYNETSWDKVANVY